ncbi:hypothetical protein Pmani_026344 [Petrolisthes manimaculis]|uniref:Ionotropic glutamate receptor C-terminal domain-containing protein n=1 Tax=Petrolisthes manimaculis TaxID=1843537 RepID=A0AAE1TXZ3_9EUCA|nr:hypothetical protein Pmani_026344 [Petrolisthes manimaculis]
MLVGLWLVGSLVIALSYRTSLISHLVVQGKSPEINSVEDLMERDGWSWGTPDMTGAFKIFLSTNPDPAMQKLHSQMQIKSVEEGMRLILGGNFAFVHSNYLNMEILVSTRYTDRSGYTPYHASTTKYRLFSGNSFAIRPGAPFFQRFRLTRQRMLEAGLLSFWTDAVMNTHKTRVRLEQRSKEQSEEFSTIVQSKRQVVLGVEQLLGAFVILVLGSIVACLSLIVEVFGIFNG